VLNSKKIRQ